MAFENLPGVFHEKQDGGLAISTVSNAPKLLLIGTASKGPSETPWVVTRAQEAAVTFGSDGTLVRGMYEVMDGGAEQVVLFRVGATAAKIEGLGVTAQTGGVSFETVIKDDGAGDTYSFYWDNSSGAQRLVVRNEDTGTIVFDRDFSKPTADTDLGEIIVSGSPTDGEGQDVGSASVMVLMSDAGTGYDLTYTAGTDGLNLSRMELFEALYRAFALLENEDFDLVVPMDVYLDDKNVADGLSYSGTSGSYPTAGSDNDMLLYVYAEEYQGEYLFWWRKDKASGNPDIYPSTTYQTQTPSGVDLTNTAFHEVNFAHFLANFCYKVSSNTNECIGFIGVRPPTSIGLKDVIQWIGEAPTYTLGSDNQLVIASSADDGSGLLGNKFLAGKYGFRANAAYGGFVLTDSGFVDGVEQEDRGGHVIDIGKYINVVGSWVTLYTAYDTSGLGYIASFAPFYAGFVSTLDAKSAPTNKVVPGIRLPFRISSSKLDQLAGMRYVFCADKPKGIVVADAPTAARPDSDYRRLTTVRIVKQVVDAMRGAADPFIGEAGGALQRAALRAACESALAKLQKGGYIQRYELNITATAAQRVNGEATIELAIVPAFELRQITLIISLKAV